MSQHPANPMPRQGARHTLVDHQQIKSEQETAMDPSSTNKEPVATEIGFSSHAPITLAPSRVSRRRFGRAGLGLGVCLLLSGIMAVAGGGMPPWSHPVHAFTTPHLEIVAEDISPDGQPTNVTVEAVRVDGTIDSSFQDTIEFTSSDHAAQIQLPSDECRSNDCWKQLPSRYTFTAADAGSHSFQVIFATAGMQTLSVTDESEQGFAGATTTFDVEPAPTPTCATAITCLRP